MDKVTIRTLAKELKLAVSTVSKALADSYEISAETKRRVHELAKQKNYIPNAYAGSLRKRKSRTIAVVLPEVADSFFSLAINGIEAAAQEKGYHVLIYLTHEHFSREQYILNNFQSGRVDGILLSVTRETPNGAHIREAISRGIPVVFFDRVCDEIVMCTDDTVQNQLLIRKLLSQKEKPNGIIACVEKLTTPIYMVCKEKNMVIPKDMKVICFSSLETAPILNPSLTTVTQPAFELGKTAATLLMKALDKPNFVMKQEYITLPSAIIIRGSTGNKK